MGKKTLVRRSQSVRKNANPVPRAAFTLTELLIVIAIIAVLSALITAAAINARNASKRAQITMEIGQMGQAFETMKNDLGAYPPNGMNATATGVQNFNGDNINNIPIADFRRMFKKAFPRHAEPPALIDALAGSLNLPSNANIDASQLVGGINAAEAIYFWLGGFSKDPQYPISGDGGPSFTDTNGDGSLLPNDDVLENRTPLYQFQLGQLGPRDSDGQFAGRYLTYTDPRNNVQRRINFWTYHPPGSEKPFVYFDASGHEPVEYDLNFNVDDEPVFALKKFREGVTSNSANIQASDVVFVNKNKFQILHPGLDDVWGDEFVYFDIFKGNELILFPTGPFTGDVADTLTNFTDGTLESAQK